MNFEIRTSSEFVAGFHLILFHMYMYTVLSSVVQNVVLSKINEKYLIIFITFLFSFVSFLLRAEPLKTFRGSCLLQTDCGITQEPKVGRRSDQRSQNCDAKRWRDSSPEQDHKSILVRLQRRSKRFARFSQTLWRNSSQVSDFFSFHWEFRVWQI